MSGFSGRFAAFVLTSGLIAGGAASAAEPAPKKQPRLDRYGDPLSDGAIYRVGSPRFRAGWFVYFLAFSKEGRQLLTTLPPWSSAAYHSRRRSCVSDAALEND